MIQILPRLSPNRWQPEISFLPVCKGSLKKDVKISESGNAEYFGSVFDPIISHPPFGIENYVPFCHWKSIV